MDDSHPNSSDLRQEINERMMKMRARTVELSVERLIEDFLENRFVIDPAYRAMFRWSAGRQSRLIESLLLELPVPPLTTIELDSVSASSLVDGLNRLFSIIHFVNGHPDDRSRRLRLVDCDIVPRLNGMVWNDLSEYHKAQMMRRPIRIDVLTKDCDPQLHYSIFKRLNSAIGSPSEHEIRECGIRLLGQSFLDFVASLSRLPEFVMATMHLHGSRRVSGYDRELALRFLAFRNSRFDYRADRADFLNEFTEAVTEGKMGFDEGRERAVFGKTFQIIGSTLGENAFTLLNVQGVFGYHFVDGHFEPFTQGLQSFLTKIDVTDKDHLRRVERAFLKAKSSPAFRRPVNRPYLMSARDLKNRIEIVEREVARALSD